MADEVKILIKGDNADLQRALKGSRSSIKRFGDGVKKVMLAAAVAAAAAAAAIVVLGRKVFSFGKHMLDLFIEQEKAEARIGAVLKATGEAAGFTKQQMLDLASAMQEVTVHGDEVILGTLAIIATFKGITGEAFKDTAILVADLADILQTDLKSAALQLGKALNDPTQGMSALRRSGVSFNEAQIEQVKLLQESGDLLGAQAVLFRELATEVGGAAAAAADTFGGRMIQMKNRLGDVGETIGESLVPMLELIGPALETGLTVLENLANLLVPMLTQAAAGAQIIMKEWQPVVDWLQTTVIAAFAVAQTAIENWQDVVALVLKRFVLAVVAGFETVKHVLTVVAPAAVEFLRDNWVDIFMNMATATETILTNVGANLAKFFTSVSLWLAGKGFDFEWTALTEGFELSLQELPKIVAREKGAIEKALELEVAALSKGLTSSFVDNLSGILKLFVQRTGPGLDEIIAAGAGAGAGADDNARIDARIAELFGGEEGAGAGVGVGGRTAGIEDLVSLNRRITQAAASTPEDKIKDAVEKGAKDQVFAIDKVDGTIQESNHLQKQFNDALPDLVGLA